MPKNSIGRIDQKSLRYMAHRYFMQKANLQIRGFEPARPVNSTHQGHAEILSQRVPAFVEMMLEGPRASMGFSLEDAVAMVATLNQLIYDSEATTLDKVLPKTHRGHAGRVSHGHENLHVTSAQLQLILEDYMISWMMGEDEA